MRRFLCLFVAVCFTAAGGFAGFKVKLVKPKKPEKFQAHVTVDGVHYAADLLLEGKDQKEFFYKELTPSRIIALRLAVFNRSQENVELALDGIRVIAPDGTDLVPLAPENVAQAVLEGLVVSTQVAEGAPVTVTPSVRSRDPRYDPSDPRYDPNDPRYDPRTDPSDPTYDPRDPRNRRDPRYGGIYRPGVDVVLNPGGGAGSGDLSQFEKQLVEKDFSDKAHDQEPVLRSFSRDKFLYFSMENPPSKASGFQVILPAGKGMSRDVTLKF